jgi:hypothetical protein
MHRPEVKDFQSTAGDFQHLRALDQAAALRQGRTAQRRRARAVLPSMCSGPA